MSDAAGLMDRMYRHQRHFYDLSRKYYLAGRDETIARLGAEPGHAVLEIGCGTGRNLIKAAKAYPLARFFGLDVSREMLDTAAVSIARAGLSSRIAIADGDAADFDPLALFGRPQFDRVLISYALSMISAVAADLGPGARSCCPERRTALRRFRRLLRAAPALQVGASSLARRLRRQPARRSGASACRAGRQARIFRLGRALAPRLRDPGRRPPQRLSSQPAPAGAPLWMKITGRPHDANSSELFSWQRFSGRANGSGRTRSPQRWETRWSCPHRQNRRREEPSYEP